MRAPQDLTRAAPGRWTRRLEGERGARLVVAVILLYVGTLFVLRLSLSPFLEIDEAQFVGNVHLGLAYGNSHPPLYNWLVRALLELTGWRWALALALLRAGLLCATFLLLFDAGRRLAGNSAGALAVALAALCPQVSWMSAHTLAHSLLVMAAASGVLHAVALALARQRGAAVLIGAWAGIGLLAKANILLLLGPLALAIAADRDLCHAVLVRPVEAALGAAIFALCGGIVALGVAAAPDEAVERVSKLYREGPFAALDIPVVGLDGALSLGLSVLAWGAIPLGLILLARRHGAPAAPQMARLLSRTLALGLAGFLVAALILDISAVHERYLTPLMMALPLLAALHLASVRWRALVLGAGALALAAVPVGVLAMVLFDTHRFARPYQALASPAAALVEGPVEVRSNAQDLAANMTIALTRLGIEAAVAGDPLGSRTPRTIAQFEPADWPVTDHSGNGWCEGESYDLAAPYANATGREMALTLTLYEPCAPSSDSARTTRARSTERVL